MICNAKIEKQINRILMNTSREQGKKFQLAT